MKSIFRWLFLVGWLHAIQLNAQNIQWFSDPNQTNLDSSGAPMDAGFRFELGVFPGGFTPTSANADEWAAHWVPADTSTYDISNQGFAGVHEVNDNTAPFSIGVEGWIMGLRDTPTGSQRILFRKGSWLWPAPDPISPFPLEWNAKDADQVVLGSINASGTPFLMQAAAVQTYAQWQTEQLTGEPLDGPNDDPDLDGASNLLEFVFGTLPLTAGTPSPTPVSLDGGHLQITIPRRSDHPAALTVEVSDDLQNWFSGPSYTEVVSDDPSALVVRDLTPLDGTHPKRFIRLRAVLP